MKKNRELIFNKDAKNRIEYDQKKDKGQPCFLFTTNNPIYTPKRGKFKRK